MIKRLEHDLRPHLLVVDDQPDNLLILEELLGEHYEVHTASGGARALEYVAEGGRADLILLDAVMPELHGFEVCRRLKAAPPTRDIPVLFLTSLDGAADEAEGLAAGAGDFIHKPFSLPVVLARVRNHLEFARAARLLKKRNEYLERMVAERSAQVVRTKQEIIAVQDATISAFCALAEARDNETGNHIRRTQNYVGALAEHLRHHPRFRGELDDEAIMLLFKSAPLHDIGKVAIPESILNKPGKLTDEEWVVMKRHPEYGRDAIDRAAEEFGDAETSFLRYAREIAYCHHERWDGAGYPQGLAGEAIPLSARLMAVADVYDALISKRVYKPEFSHENALSIIVEGRGTHFDPAVVDALLEIRLEFRAIARKFRD
ncbi:MAG TPA: HD domain-containing phosphohydrolase [Aromatoleum sp.]|uniref:HD domain-containing phosphohydrolase n=1 Tax=Aromatoleum sp. TaxID=2307007 RepID=UPI002B47CD43|nr:HD domain-containing phosphohydrolase [Aromatoleum sp.]HJV24996.1 HD domain-containing phosphohydrolase [Aromatoleum sp.]